MTRLGRGVLDKPRERARRQDKADHDRDPEAAKRLELHREHRGEPDGRHPAEDAETRRSDEGRESESPVRGLARSYERRQKEQPAHSQVVPHR